MSTVVFKKKIKKGAQPRKRVHQDHDASSESEDEIIRGKSGSASAGVSIGTKKHKKVDEGADLEVLYSGDRSAVNKNINDATRETADIDGYSVASLLGKKSIVVNDSTSTSAHSGEEKTRVRPHAGPVKAPTNIRGITVIDYQPDVCKDYKQTGFCGFGDTCKFLHDRGDFKQGWQLDKDWEDVGKNQKSGHGVKTDKANDESISDIPFKCIICKSDYKNPIITKCGHYFCESCAIQRYKKNPQCAQCGVGTGGLFSGAKKLKLLLEDKQRRITEKEGFQPRSDS